MYAVIEAGGRQYKVQAGDLLTIDRITGEEGSTITIDRVLMVGNGDELKVGAPVVAGAVVRATVVGHGRDEKKLIFRYRSKNRYRVKKGHRQPNTSLRIESIDL